MSLELLNRAYTERYQRYVGAVGAAQAIQDTQRDLAAQAAAKKAEATTMEQVAALFQAYSEAEQQELTSRIEGLVTMGLQTVFPEAGLALRLDSKTERGQAAMRFLVVSTIDGTEVATDVLEARGGGVAAVIGFLLRLVVLLLDRTGKRRFLFLDETFGQLSAEHQPALGRLLRYLVDETGVQVVLVTHQRELAEHADVAYNFSHDGSRSIVERTES